MLTKEHVVAWKRYGYDIDRLTIAGSKEDKDLLMKTPIERLWDVLGNLELLQNAKVAPGLRVRIEHEIGELVNWDVDFLDYLRDEFAVGADVAFVVGDFVVLSL